MIRIELSDEHLSQTRLALSPLWELVASLFLLHSDEPPPEYTPWLARTRRRLHERGLDDLGIGINHTCPDFVGPIPTDPLASLEDEIERVRATDPDRVRADLADAWPDGPPPPWDRFVERPVEMVDRLCDRLYAYWEAAIADDWPQLRAVLEGEMLGRARSLALSGPGAVLEELHPAVRWRPPVVEITKRKKAHRAELSGRPLVLVPLVFAGPVLLANQENDRIIGIGYQARGTAALWTSEEASHDERLELLLGHGRAAVLRALSRPSTTTELAARLSYAPSTVSAHLDVLSRAGLLERHRVQRRVFYGLNDTGSALVTLLADLQAALTA